MSSPDLDMGWAAKEITDRIVVTLTDLCEKRSPLLQMAPDELMCSIVEQACSLQWAVRENSQQTDKRTLELSAALLLLELSRARAGELDLTAGDAA